MSEPTTQQQQTVGAPNSPKIIVSGFAAFYDARQQNPALGVMQWLSSCGVDGGKQPNRLHEFKPRSSSNSSSAEINLFSELDWVLGDAAGDDSSAGGAHAWKVVPKNEDDDDDDDTMYHLTIQPPPKRDFWRKTYYEPVLIKDDAPFLYCTVPRHEYCTVTTTFQLTAGSQFDQAGLMVRLGYDHWLKTGIEVVDGRPLLSCVVTNTYSDWSTQPFGLQGKRTRKPQPVVHVPACRMRVHCRGTNFVVQVCDDGEDGAWRMIRIAHLSPYQSCRPDPLSKQPAPNGPNPGHQEMWVGLFAACPVEQQGCTVTFTEFEVKEGSDFDHSA